MQAYEFTSMTFTGEQTGSRRRKLSSNIPFAINCLNWALEHIVTNRSHALEMVDAPHG